MRKLTSPANTGTAGGCTRACASWRMACHCGSSARKGNMRSKAKRRCRPGAMPQAICAASMAMVPAPQQGSSSGPSAGRPCQPAAASRAAASVSFRGASPLTSWRPPWASRQPRLKRASPEVSANSVAWSGPTYRTSGRSGWRVSTLGRSPVASRITSHTASLMRRAAKFTLRSGLAWALTSTRSVCAGVIQSGQGTRRARSYRSCSSRYGPSTSGHSTRWARRLSRFSCIACAALPWAQTPPRPACAGWLVRRCTSSASRASEPPAAGRNRSTVRDRGAGAAALGGLG